MIISKESKLIEILNETFSMSRTPRISTVVTAVQFISEVGIIIRFEDNPRSIFVKDESVQMNFTIFSSLFVSVLVAAVEANGSVEIKMSDGIVTVNGFKFTDTGSDYIHRPRIENPHITFTKEQFLKLERDFDITIGNYFSNPKNTDSIGFAFTEGKVYEIAPGASLYKISKFDALIDEVQIEQDFGHDDKIFLMSRKIFDIVKHSDGDIKFYFDTNNGIVKINTDLMEFSYTYQQFGTNKFKSNLSLKGFTDGFALKNFEKAIPVLRNITPYFFESSEDSNVCIEIKSDKITIDIEDIKKEIPVELPIEGTYLFNTNINALMYVINSVSLETASIKDIGSDMIEVMDGETYFYLPNGIFSD